MNNKIIDKKGGILNVVLVVVIILTILSAAVFMAVSTNSKRKLKESEVQLEKIEIENALLDYLNESVLVVNNGNTLVDTIYKDNYLITCEQDIEIIEKYEITINKQSSKISLFYEVLFDINGYQILRKGFSNAS